MDTLYFRDTEWSILRSISKFTVHYFIIGGHSAIRQRPVCPFGNLSLLRAKTSLTRPLPRLFGQRPFEFLTCFCSPSTRLVDLNSPDSLSPSVKAPIPPIQLSLSCSPHISDRSLPTESRSIHSYNTVNFNSLLQCHLRPHPFSGQVSSQFALNPVGL